MTWKGYLTVSESPTPMGSIERGAHDGLQTIVTDNAQDSRFQAVVDGQVIAWQPYRRYRGHIVLMATEVDARWRNRGVSSAMIGGCALTNPGGRTNGIPREDRGRLRSWPPEYRDRVPTTSNIAPPGVAAHCAGVSGQHLTELCRPGTRGSVSAQS